MTRQTDRFPLALLLVIGLVALVAVIAIIRPGTVQTSEVGNDENVAGLATERQCDLTALQRNGQIFTYTVNNKQLTIRTVTDGTTATVTVNGQTTPPLTARQAATLPDGTTITILNIVQSKLRVRFCLNLGQAPPPSCTACAQNTCTTSGQLQTCINGCLTAPVSCTPGTICQAGQCTIPPSAPVTLRTSPDIVEATRIAGWAYAIENPALPITITIYSDGQPVATFPADLLRPDVNAAFGITGNHGFDRQITLPAGQHALKLIASSGMTNKVMIEKTVVNTPPPTRYQDLHAITFYDYPATGAQRHAHLAQSLPAMKDTGFNTVWLVTPWAIMDPKPLQAPAQYNEAEFAQLRSTLQLLKQNDMKAIIGLNYLGPGWAPQGIDACEWARNQTQYAAFEEYAKDFLLRIRDYKDDVYILVFTENSFPCDSEPWTRGDEHALLLQQRLGSLPTRLPADLRRDFRIGYHDNLLITEGWSTLSPISDPNPFDFLSTVAYGLESSTDEQITTALDIKVARFRAKYPTAPLIIGEYGASSCGQDANQARVDKAITGYAVQNGLGLNLWGWRPLNNGDECKNNAANGLSITNMDGTNKPAVAAVKSVLRPGS